MIRSTRREMMGLLGASSAAMALSPALAATQTPDLIVFNAQVHTVDDAMPKAEAFAIAGGRFIAVGTTDEIKSLAGPKTQTLDAKRMTILPGFVDCHNHASGEQVLYEVAVGNPYGVEFVTIRSIIDKLKAKAATTPPGYWVEGYFYDDTKVKDNRPIDLHDLDQVSTDHPVAVHHRGAHSTFYNSKALALAGITNNTPPAFGGTYDKDARGNLTGRVTDRARDVFDKVGKRPVYTQAQTDQRGRDGIAFISKQFVKAGLTSVCHSGGNLAALQQVREKGDLRHRVSYEATGAVLDALINSGAGTGLGDEWIRIGATFEHNADGSLSERTMAISKPYIGITPPYQGNVTEKQEDLNAWADRINRAGLQMNCHANGDVAIEHVVTAYEKALKAFPRANARPKITHCSLINDDLVRRIKALNATPALFTTYAYYNADKFHFYGEEMMRHMMAYRTLLDAGIPACAGSDFGAGVYDPLMGIQGMVTRTGWNGETWGANQKITVDEAIRVSTLNGAWDTHEEKIKGSISIGKLADFVILADDPHTVDPGKIKDIKVVRTVTGGNTVYQA